MYTPIYYQTIRDTGIDPVVCSDLSAWPPAGVAPGRAVPPVQLAEKALAKAARGKSPTPRKRPAKKAAEPVAEPGRKAGAGTAKGATRARGTAKMAVSN